MKLRSYKELYVLIIKESGDILTSDSFRIYWKNYGKNELGGWRPAKKIYYTLGHARSGFSHIPEAIKDKVAIAKFIQGQICEDGAEIVVKQKIKKDAKEKARAEWAATWSLECAEKELDAAKNRLDALKSLDADKKK